MKNEYSYLSDRCHSAGTACLFSHRLAERREYVMGTILQYVLYLAILVVLAVLFGKYIGRIMHVKEDEEMGWKRYVGSVFVFSITALIVLMLIHMLQAVLPWNPQEQKGISWDLAFNNAVSFITNTNWKAYSGESSLSYFTQVMGLTVQNFSAYETVDLVEPINMEDAPR